MVKLLCWMTLLIAFMNFALGDGFEDYVKRRMRIEPEFANLFSEHSFIHNATYKKQMGQLNRVSRGPTNGKTRAAAMPGAENYKHYCVGIANEPWRTQIFEDRMDCDINGWDTLLSFCVPKKFVDNFPEHYTEGGCVGYAANPSRSMYFQGTGDCSRNGWDHSFFLMSQGSTYPGSPVLNFYKAYDPNRMSIRPQGVSPGGGWDKYDSIMTVMVSFPMTPSGAKLYKKNEAKYQDVHKRARLSNSVRALKITVSAVVQVALNLLNKTVFTLDDPVIVQDFSDHEYIRTLMNSFHETGDVRIARGINWGTPHGHKQTLLMLVGNELYGSVTVDTNLKYPKDMLQRAFGYSMTQFSTAVLSADYDTNYGVLRGFVTTDRGEYDVGLFK